MSMRKNVMNRTLVVLAAVVVAMVLCTAMSHAATVKVISKIKMHSSSSVTRLKYNKAGRLISVKGGAGNRTFTTKFSYSKGKLRTETNISGNRTIGWMKLKNVYSYKKGKLSRCTHTVAYKTVKSQKWKKGEDCWTAYCKYKKNAKYPYQIVGLNGITFRNIRFNKFGFVKSYYGDNGKTTFKYKKNGFLKKDNNGGTPRTHTYKSLKKGKVLKHYIKRGSDDKEIVNTMIFKKINVKNKAAVKRAQKQRRFIRNSILISTTEIAGPSPIFFYNFSI